MSNSLPTDVREDYHALVRNEVIPHVPKDGGTLLDLGGGIGATALRLKSLGHVDRVGVVDMVHPPAGAQACDFSYAGNLEDPALLEQVIAEQGPFDTILCLDILEHLADPWRVIAQLHSGLAPGGVIVASIPNVRHYTVSVPLFFGNRWTLQDAGILDRTHLRFFVRDSAVALMTSSGLTLDAVIPWPGGRWKIRWLRKLTLGLFNSFTNFQYIIRVRRER